MSDSLKNPLSFLLRAALLYPTHPALVHADVPHPSFYTFETWAQRVQNLAYALKQLHIQPGDRVAVISPNTPMMADALQGVLAARAVIVAINIRLKPSDVSYILEHSGAKLIIIDSQFAHLIEDKMKSIPTIMCNDTGRAGDPYEELLSNGRRFSQEKGWDGLALEGDENANAILCYTSGTTGRPKGVMTSYRGTYLAAIANAYETSMTRESRYLWILPMFHAAGWTFPWSCTFSIATQITLRVVDNDLIWKNLAKTTHFCAAPTVLIGLVNHGKAHKVAHPIKAAIAGAAPTAHLLEELEKINIAPVHVYGLTETYGPFTRCYPQPSWSSLSPSERAKFHARQGHAFITADNVRVVDSEMNDVPRDGKTMGEIVTSGNIVMKEYFMDEEATEKAFKGGVFHSGDLAVMYEDGAIGILDRSKDIIISGGENASSLAIEQELATHPHVLEVTVIARSHPKWGERPMAFCVLHEKHEEQWSSKAHEFEKDLISHARTRLPGFACPEWVVIVKELPKTGTGKIQKHELRKRLAKL
ncbi:hypothetical protein DL96DRAFT_32999 [Flagelloscypha sp. PMI_526]|nr:hypothetical protein DL96DRAFT_32999 [Flagelloscypha sp. PMI_526]